MKKIIYWVIPIIIIILLVFGIYKVFIDCSKAYAHSGNKFKLEEIFDYAKVDDEVYVKLINIEDNRCNNDDGCNEASQIVVSLLVVSDSNIAYIKLGTLEDTTMELEKFKYDIELIDVSEDFEVTLKLTKQE